MASDDGELAPTKVSATGNKSPAKKAGKKATPAKGGIVPSQPADTVANARVVEVVTSRLAVLQQQAAAVDANLEEQVGMLAAGEEQLAELRTQIESARLLKDSELQALQQAKEDRQDLVKSGTWPSLNTSFDPNDSIGSADAGEPSNNNAPKANGLDAAKKPDESGDGANKNAAATVTKSEADGTKKADASSGGVVTAATVDPNQKAIDQIRDSVNAAVPDQSIGVLGRTYNYITKSASRVNRYIRGIPRFPKGSFPKLTVLDCYNLFTNVWFQTLNETVLASKKISDFSYQLPPIYVNANKDSAYFMPVRVSYGKMTIDIEDRELYQKLLGLGLKDEETKKTKLLWFIEKTMVSQDSIELKGYTINLRRGMEALGPYQYFMKIKKLLGDNAVALINFPFSGMVAHNEDKDTLLSMAFFAWDPEIKEIIYWGLDGYRGHEVLKTGDYQKEQQRYLKIKSFDWPDGE
jgi:hypothetical protein